MQVKRLAIYPLLLVAVVGSYAYARHYKKVNADLAKNYQPSYIPPAGWTAVPHSPMVLFEYVDPKTNLELKGAVNQMVSEYNPTPDMDTDGIAQYYIDRTRESMPAWSAARLGKYQTGQEAFEVVRRSTKDRVVITAYSVKGNTTFLITLFGKGKAMGDVDPHIPDLYHLLDTVKLGQRDMSAL